MKRSITALLACVLVLTACQAAAPVASPSPAPAAAVPRGAFGGGTRLALAPSAARTAAFTGDPADLSATSTLLIQLDVTAVTGTTPTLDVKVQTTVDGATWCDVAAFTQASAVSRRLIRITVSSGAPQAEVACTDGTLAAGTAHQGAGGQRIRVKHSTPGGTTPSFTYSITAWAGN